MNRLTFEEFLNADFRLYENNPVIKHPINSFVAADPSVLTPDETKDGKWHLFCHATDGVYHYESDDGISFSKGKRILNRAMRPNVNLIDGTYYLFYERTKSLFENFLSLFGGKWKSEIYFVKSDDLVSWSEPKLVIGNTRSYEKDKRGISISNPFLIKRGDTYRLYYSCGLTYIKDCGFCEPTHISFAESKSPYKDYVSRETPIISPDKNIEYLNLCSGCLKVYKLKDCYIGLQNGIFAKDGKSHSAIMLLKSEDGENFEFVKPFLVPQMCEDNNWMAQFVYACCLTYCEGELRLYFNARNIANPVFGRENIGMFSAKIKEEKEND